MKTGSRRIAACLCLLAAVLSCALLLCGAAGRCAPERERGAALAAACRWLEESFPLRQYFPDGSFRALSARLCRMGFTDPEGNTLTLTLRRAPLGGYRVTGAVRGGIQAQSRSPF